MGGLIGLAIVGHTDRASGVSIAEDPTLVGHECVNVACERGAGAVEVTGALVPDFGDELGVDDSLDVGLPDVPDALVEDSQIDKRELMGEQVEVLADRDCGFEVAVPVVVETEICFETTELDEGRVAFGQGEEDLGVE